MIDLSFVGWLTLAGAALLAWVAFPALAPGWRLFASIACAVLTGVVMLNPPEGVMAAPEVATRPEPASVPPAPVAARKATPKAVEPAQPAVEPDPPAVEPDPPKQDDHCVAFAGLNCPGASTPPDPA